MKRLVSVIAALGLLLCASVPAQAADAYDAKWGKFSTVTISGSGADVVQLAKPLVAGILVASHDGEANFIVHSFNSKLKPKEYLVNEIGPFSGSVAFGIGYTKSKTYGFEIEADGAWTLILKPFSMAKTLTKSGRGFGVYKVTYPSRKILKFTHDGSANFIVHQFCTNGSIDYVVNEIGRYSGKKIVSAGKCLLEIMADGNWTIK